MSNKGMKIGEGQKYDVTQVSKEGLTAEDIAKMDKAARKLIDIYNTDGKAGLSQIELARAMDDFYFADYSEGENEECDDKLSNKELDELADDLNKKNKLSGDDAITRKDLKSFLKAVRKFTKGDEKISSIDVKNNFADEKAKQLGYQKLEGQQRIYEKDGKYYRAMHDEENSFSRIKFDDNNNWHFMRNSDLKAEQAQERQAKIDKKAEEGGYEDFLGSGSYYIKNDDITKKYVYDDNKNDFVRAKCTDNDEYVAMTPDEITAEDAEITQRNRELAERMQRRQALETPKEYTVQLGESLTSILKRSLEAQGKEVNAENLAAAKAEFINNNPKAVHKNSRGVEYLYAGDVVKIAGNLENKANGDEIKAAARQRQQRVSQQQETKVKVQQPKAEVKAQQPKAEVNIASKYKKGMMFDENSKSINPKGYVILPNGNISITFSGNNKALKKMNDYSLQNNKKNRIVKEVTVEYSFYPSGRVKKMFFKYTYTDNKKATAGIYYQDTPPVNGKRSHTMDLKYVGMLGIDTDKPDTMKGYNI